MLDDGTDVRAPIAGVVAGLRAAANDVAVVLPVDTPRVVRRVAPRRSRPPAATRQSRRQARCPAPTGKSVLPALEHAIRSGELSLRRALEGADVVQVDLDPAELVNINTPDDLARL